MARHLSRPRPRRGWRLVAALPLVAALTYGMIAIAQAVNPRTEIEAGLVDVDQAQAELDSAEAHFRTALAAMPTSTTTSTNVPTTTTTVAPTTTSTAPPTTTTTAAPPTTTTSGGAFDPLSINCAAIGTTGTPVNNYRTELRNLVRNSYTAYTPTMGNVRVNGGFGDAAIGSPPGGSTGTFPPFRWNGVYLTLAGYLPESSTAHADAFQAWSFVPGGGIIEKSCFGVAEPGPYPTSRRPNALVIIKSDFQAANGSQTPVGNITFRDSVFDLTNGNGYNSTIYIRDSGSSGSMPSTLWRRRPQYISFVNVVFVGANPSISSGYNNNFRALFVHTEAERNAAVARQQSDPGVIAERIAAVSHTCSTDCADARTWIVWDARRENGQAINPPGGYFTDVP